MRKKRRDEETIDDLVVAKANDMTKWEAPIKAHPSVAMAIYLKPRIFEKAKKIARRKKVKNYRQWLTNIIVDQLRREEKELQTRDGNKKRRKSAVS